MRTESWILIGMLALIITGAGTTLWLANTSTGPTPHETRTAIPDDRIPR